MVAQNEDESLMSLDFKVTQRQSRGVHMPLVPLVENFHYSVSFALPFKRNRLLSRFVCVPCCDVDALKLHGKKQSFPVPTVRRGE